MRSCSLLHRSERGRRPQSNAARISPNGLRFAEKKDTSDAVARLDAELGEGVLELRVRAAVQLRGPATKAAARRGRAAPLRGRARPRRGGAARIFRGRAVVGGRSRPRVPRPRTSRRNAEVSPTRDERPAPRIGRDEVVAGLHERHEAVHLRRLARRDGERVGQRRGVVVVAVRQARGALQLGDLVLEDVRRRVHEARVDRAELRQLEERAPVLRGLELEPIKGSRRSPRRRRRPSATTIHVAAAVSAFVACVDRRVERTARESAETTDQPRRAPRFDLGLSRLARIPRRRRRRPRIPRRRRRRPRIRRRTSKRIQTDAGVARRRLEERHRARACAGDQTRRGEDRFR